jgi:hypothetical protein
VVKLPLNPVELFLLVEPGLWKPRSTKCAATSLKKFDHREGVVALV